MTATMYLPKECSPDANASKAFISNGGIDPSYCSPGQTYNPGYLECVMPFIFIDGIKFGLEDSEETTGPAYLHGFIVPIPEIVLPKAVFDNFTSDMNLTLDETGYYIIDCKVDFETRLVIDIARTSYTIPIVYLVDRLARDVCVLRMRWLDPKTDNYCSTVCGMPTRCTETSVILGLPFLHRYCVSYDPAAGSVGLYNLINVARNDLRSICDYSKFSPFALTPKSPGRAKVPTWAIGVSACFVLVVIILISGALFLWWKRRRRRRRIIANLSKKYASSRRANQYVPQAAMRRDKWELLPSDVIFAFANKIGSGAFADVYKGFIASSKISVAIKLAKDALDESRLDLQREIDFMKDLGTHAHVLSMVGHTTLEDDRLALVLEFCSNGDLSNWLLSHARCIKMTTSGTDTCELHSDTTSIMKQLLSFAWQISDGLVYLASRGLVHRDIAARNVLLANDLTAKISDFGLCRRTEGNVYNTKHGKLPIKWMAPEALKTGTFTAKTDVWSYGILLYEIYAAGSLPFPHVQPYEQLGVLELGERPEQPEACPDNIYDLMRRCWQVEPDERPAAPELKQYLEGIIGSTSAAYGYFDFADVAESVTDEAL